MPSTPPNAAQTGPSASPLGLLPSEAPEPGRRVKLHNGRTIDIRGWDTSQLTDLHWEQERLFAADILASTKGSQDRKNVTAQAYTTVCSILEELNQLKPAQDSTVFSMGMDPRYGELVSHLLSTLPQPLSERPFFELGFSAGGLLKKVADAGYAVAGLEVVEDLRRQATEVLPSQFHSSLFVGDFLATDLTPLVGQCGMVYWNDVFEHIHPDEIDDYVAKLYSLLAPGGQLITITPNWHMRPSDVTNEFEPPRSEAIGFHLKEYRLSEVVTVLKRAGFSRVTTPSFISRQKIYHSKNWDLTGVKSTLEPLLEWLPYSVAVQVCRRFGFNLTIAHKQD